MLEELQVHWCLHIPIGFQMIWEITCMTRKVFEMIYGITSVFWLISMVMYISDDMHINSFFIPWVFEMIGKSVHLYTCGYLS
jgi:hypothetical protein